jgi:hypothetical protein
LKVLIVVYEGDEWKRDTLEARMVDVRVDNLVAELTLNQVPVQVIRQTEQEKWSEDDANVMKYPGLKAIRSMRDFIQIHGEDALLELLKKEAD